MKDPRMMVPEEGLNPKTRRKPANNAPHMFQAQGENVKGVKQTLPPPLKTSKKALKRSLKPEASSPSSFQQPERSTSDSLPDSSNDGDEYRNLRRKYMLLEDESFALGKELLEVEDEVKTLEDEKLALLDQLVVLEGLIDPSEIQTHRQPPA